MYQMDFCIGYVVDNILMFLLQLPEIFQDILQLVLVVPSRDHIRSVRSGVFRRDGKKLTGCALVADLEPGNFVEIDGLGHPCRERPRLHEFYQNAHANPRPARCSAFAAFILIVTHSRGHPARPAGGHTTGRPGCL